MFIGKKFTFEVIWKKGKKNFYKSLIISAVAVILYQCFEFSFIAIPFLPIATIGTAVAFYVGFKNNQAYERLWEARKLWGGITNVSRILSASVLSLVKDESIRSEILLRHLAYVNILRLQLRKTIDWASSNESIHRDSVAASEEIKDFDIAVKELFIRYNKVEIYERVKNKNNIASDALLAQYVVLARLKKEGIIDDYEHSDITKLFAELYNLQGGCERIKNTPLFRQFSILSRVFMNIFMFLLPFGLLSTMGEFNSSAGWAIWLTIPFSILISWVFTTMEQIGEISENPFDNGVHDTPMSAICRNIEIDVLELMGEKVLPERIKPFNDILL